MADSFFTASRFHDTDGSTTTASAFSKEVQPYLNSQTFLPLCCGLVGTILILSLTYLPITIKLLLGLVLGLVVYGTMAAYFQNMRLWMLLALVSLTLFCLCHNAWGERNRARNLGGRSLHSVERLSEHFPGADQYHMLLDGLFVHKAYWKAHGGELQLITEAR